MRHYFVRHQSPAKARDTLLAGIGGAVAIGILGAITYYAGQPLLMAPFGASCVLLFCAPNSPLSQPLNVVVGHLLSTVVGLLLRGYLSDSWWGAALAVGLAISLMAALRVTHPPAGADPIIVFATHPELNFLVFPVLIGSAALVLIASVFHAGSGAEYPLRKRA